MLQDDGVGYETLLKREHFIAVGDLSILLVKKKYKVTLDETVGRKVVIISPLVYLFGPYSYQVFLLNV